MSFLTPAAFFLAGLLPVIVIMYLLKLRRVERTVASTYLWRQMVRDVEANAPWQRLRRNLLLILQLIFLALLILALARPTTPTQGISARAAIFIMDTSASMAATDVNPSRLEAAKDQARRLVDSLPENAQVTVIAAGQKARVAASASTDRRQVLQAIESLQPGADGADLSVALQLAAAIARRQPDTQTIILSDGNADLPERLSIVGQVRYWPIGTSNDNQAIGLLNLQPELGNARGDLTAFAQVINYGQQPAQRRLAVYADGQLVNASDVSLPAGGEQSVLAQGILSTTQVVEARLLPDGAATGGANGENPAGADQNGTPQAPAQGSQPTPDYLALDDQAVAVHRPTKPVSVTLASAGNLFLETGLSLLPSLQVTRLNPGTALPEAALTILDGYVPLTQTLPGEALLFIGPLQSTQFFSVTGTIPSPQPRPASEAEPLLQYVELNGINILDSARIPLPAWAHPVIVADVPATSGQPDGTSLPLLFAGEVDGRRVAVLAFDLRRSDLPLNLAFPLLLSNLSAWLAPGQNSAIPDQVMPGTALTISLPPEALAAGRDQITVRHPDGRRTTLQANNGQAVFAGTDQLGLYQVDNGGNIPLSFAVNLFAPQESQLEPRQELPVEGVAAAGAGGLTDNTAYREWWRLLAALALGVLTAEWLVYHRAKVAMIFKRLQP